MLVKICGVTTYDDARLCLDAGADWLGLNLVAGPRRITESAALNVARQLGASPPVVVLVHACDVLSAPFRATTLRQAGCARLQLYGQPSVKETAGLRAAGFELIYVHSVAAESTALDFPMTASPAAQPDYILFDASVPGKLGGTGVCADWQAANWLASSIRATRGPKIILAGGLRPDNVAQAIAAVRPDGVDVSSGVEQSPGRKDRDLVGHFVAAARAAFAAIKRNASD